MIRLGITEAASSLHTSTTVMRPECVQVWTLQCSEIRIIVIRMGATGTEAWWWRHADTLENNGSRAPLASSLATVYMGLNSHRQTLFTATSPRPSTQLCLPNYCSNLNFLESLAYFWDRWTYADFCLIDHNVLLSTAVSRPLARY